MEGECPLFDAVAVMHSEILLVSKEGGFLYHWPCVNQGGVSKARPHPLTESLNLGNGGIYILKSSNVRASVVLKTGEIATFYDPILRGLCACTCVFETKSHLPIHKDIFLTILYVHLCITLETLYIY